MFANKLRQDATASTKAIVYQLCVAVQKCYEMVKGQKVLIESKGDVTVEGCVQVEVKNYHDHLTDNHSNFWNTLHNWMKDDFDVNPYASLILFTTQQFGENATIRKWNYSDAKKRLEILKEIHKLSEARVAKQSQKRPGEKSKTPTSLVHQRFVLDDSRADKLSDVIGKFVIEACAPDLPELHAVIKQRWLKGALEGKRDDFLDALIGYVSQPQFGLGRSWEITYEAFDSKVGELMNLYNRETKVFPSKFFGNMGPPDPQILKEHRNHTFVRKIEDIEYSEVIPDAIGDYLAAVRTIKDEFKELRCFSEKNPRIYE